MGEGLPAGDGTGGHSEIPLGEADAWQEGRYVILTEDPALY